MTTAANPKKPARSMTYHADLGVVYLTVGAEPCTGYYLDLLRGGAWAWTKFGTREQYTVNAAAGTCTCKAARFRLCCKHVDGTRKLLELGRIGGAK